jgi:hypothetical protein
MCALLGLRSEELERAIVHSLSKVAFAMRGHDGERYHSFVVRVRGSNSHFSYNATRRVTMRG